MKTKHTLNTFKIATLPRVASIPPTPLRHNPTHFPHRQITSKGFRFTCTHQTLMKPHHIGPHHHHHKQIPEPQSKLHAHTPTCRRSKQASTKPWPPNPRSLARSRICVASVPL